MHRVNLWIFVKNRSNEIHSHEMRSNEIGIRREPPVHLICLQLLSVSMILIGCSVKPNLKRSIEPSD